MVEAKRVVWEREHNGRAWLAFHVAHLPHQKRPIKLADLMIIRRQETDPPKGWQSTAEIETMMRRWRFAMVTPRATPPPPAPIHLK